MLIKLTKDFLINNFGQDAFDKMIAQMDPEHQEILLHVINTGSWYPEKTFVALLDQAYKSFGRGDYKFCRQIGMYLANECIPKAFKFLISFGNPDFVRIRTSALFWRQLHSTGTLKVIPTGPYSDIAQLIDFAFPNKAHCYVVMGFNQAAMEMSGVKEYSSRKTKCVADGDKFCEYEST